MAGLIANVTSSAPYSALPFSYWEPLWYVAHTRANHEKRVAEQLARRSVEHFLPLYQTVRRWKDRRGHVQRPLFPGYVFVRIALHDRLQVLQVSGVANLVGFSGTPTALPSEEMDALRTSLVGDALAEPRPYLTAGRRVRVRRGSFAGMTGILVKKKNRVRFVLSVEMIQRSIAVEMDETDLEAE